MTEKFLYFSLPLHFTTLHITAIATILSPTTVPAPDTTHAPDTTPVPDTTAATTPVTVTTGASSLAPDQTETVHEQKDTT